MKMQFKRKSLPDTYICELTKYLDEVSKLSDCEYYEFMYHYIVADDLCKKEKCLAIRVPGGTVGWIGIDDNNTIHNIRIDTDYVVKSYPDNVEELVQQKYIGTVIEY